MATFKTAFPACGPAVWASTGRPSYRGGIQGPTNTVAPVVSGTETEGETLSCTEGTWAGEGSITYAYQWRRDGSNIGGATSATYDLTGDDVDAMIDCRVTATDDNGAASVNSNAVGPIEAAAAELWAGYFAAAGITNGTAQTAVNTFYNGLATDGIQAKIKVFVLLGAEAATAKNMMSDAYHGALVNSPTFTQWLGVDFNDTDNYVSTGTALASITGITQNSTMIAAGASSDTPPLDTALPSQFLYAESTGSGYEAAVIASNPADESGVYKIYADGAVNDGFLDIGVADQATINVAELAHTRWYISRTGATAAKAYFQGAVFATSTTPSVALPNVPMFMGAANIDGTPNFSGHPGEYITGKWYAIGEELSDAEIALLDARIVTLINALEAL